MRRREEREKREEREESDSWDRGGAVRDRCSLCVCAYEACRTCAARAICQRCSEHCDSQDALNVADRLRLRIHLLRHVHHERVRLRMRVCTMSVRMRVCTMSVCVCTGGYVCACAP